MARSPRASARSRSAVSARTWRGTEPPRKVGTAGRARSAASSSTSGAPSSRWRQYASCSPARSPCHSSRCQAAKSAYCTASSGRGEGRPASYARRSAASSRSSTPRLHPSLTMWCMHSSSTRRAGSSRSSRARKGGPASRSKGRAASSSAWRATSASRSTGSSFDRSRTGRVKPAKGRTLCTETPSTSANTVRSTSWRRTISPSARSSAASSTGPCSGSAAGTL
ncbi:MAG TPA: hypothetical protein VFJ82_06165 [Longimicrobium sp.]|nr:hypothetical protein [Longimicrobium sp.]